MEYVAGGVYGLFLLVAVLNLLLMRRPSNVPGPVHEKICVLIPARDEEANLARLIPQLREPNPGLKVYVYDDQSSDLTAEVAAGAGAIVLRGGDLPTGWTGKNWACHQLAQASSEDSNAEWLLFLDADVEPAPSFLTSLLSLTPGRRVITGFPEVVPGKGVEPLFLAWVGWILLSTNPFGLVARVGKGHNRFTNGQIHLWRRDVYTGLWPNERVKGQVMEDVGIGRMLAGERVPVEVANLSRLLKVRMYDNWRQTLDGMSKNSFEITGTVVGSMLLALFLFAVAWIWSFAPWTLSLLVLNGLVVAAIARAPLWPSLLMPIAISIGALTVLRSTHWRRRGVTRWKGRIYP